MLQFMGDYAFTHKPVAQNSPEVQIFPHAALETDLRHRGIALGDPPALAAADRRAAAIKLDSPGPVGYKSEARRQQLPDFRLPEIPLDAHRRRPAALKSWAN